MSQDVDCLVSGVQTVEELDENVAAVKPFKEMPPEEMSALLARTRKGPVGTKVERYKRKEDGATGPVRHDGDPA